MLPGEPIRLGPVPTRSGPRTRADVERNTSARLSEFMQARFGASPSRRLGTECENRLLCGRSLRPPADGMASAARTPSAEKPAPTHSAWVKPEMNR